mmetsp:Transcript_11836/g.31971  ORF Transcript_11836/g.31971 Transcript_11836/m.31971 type:complete len:129 (+) Transcript_11836:3561-3947(+)
MPYYYPKSITEARHYISRVLHRTATVLTEPNVVRAAKAMSEVGAMWCMVYAFADLTSQPRVNRYYSVANVALSELVDLEEEMEELRRRINTMMDYMYGVKVDIFPTLDELKAQLDRMQVYTSLFSSFV